MNISFYLRAHEIEYDTTKTNREKIGHQESINKKIPPYCFNLCK